MLGKRSANLYKVKTFLNLRYPLCKMNVAAQWISAFNLSLI